MDAARPVWTALADEQTSVFATWEWADAWWRHFGSPHHALYLHEVRDASNRPIGLLPLYVSRAGRLLRFLGHGVADQLGPVCRPEHGVAVAAALRGLVEGARPRVLLAENMRADEPWAAILRGRAIRRRNFPIIELGGTTWEEWLAGKSRNFRHQVLKAERRVARAGRLDFQLFTRPGEVADALEVMIRLHDERWNGASTAFAQGQGDFHRDFARTAARRGWLRLWHATLDGEAVAAWLGYHFNGVVSSYLMGRSPRHDHLDVGTVLRMHTIREAAADVHEYRLLTGDEEWKRRLTSVDPGVETHVVGLGAVPSVAQGLVRHKRFLPSPARRALATTLNL